MKRFLYLFSFVCLMGGGVLYAQDNDPVLMTIAGKNVLRSEFEYSLNKNVDNPKTITDEEIKEYVDIYINYRLKVQAAIDAKLDTLASFKKEYRTYRDAQLRSYLYDSIYADSVAHTVYKTIKNSVGDSDIVLLSHILLYIPQNSTNAFAELQKKRVDSIYNALVDGGDFADLASRFSDDKNSVANGGKLPWIAASQVVPEFRDVAYSLKPGSFSKPFLSPAGYHIIYLHERKPLESYEEKKSELLEVLNKNGLQEEAAERKIKQMLADSNGKMSREDILLRIQSEAEKKNPQLKNLLAEYHDGLLLYEALSRTIWQNATNDDNGLREFFKHNKNKYKWDAPRFRGYVFRTRSKAMLGKISKTLKGCKSDEGLNKLKEQISTDSLKFIKVHFGIYKNGDDPIVDYKIFKSVNNIRENKVLPYYGVIGKKLKQPKDVVDVKSRVLNDYQTFQEKNWVNALRKKYNFSVDYSLLSTINKHN